MKQIFKTKRSRNLSSIFAILFIPIAFAVFIINSGNIFDWTNPLLLIVIVIVVIISIFFGNTGNLELENEVLYRKRFKKIWWSIDVPSITDVISGNAYFGLGDPINTMNSNRSWMGLYFRDTQEKFYKIPYDLQDQLGLINALKIINPAIKFNTQVDIKSFLNLSVSKGDTRWVGDMRFKNTKIIIFIISAILLVALTILNGLK